MPAALDVNREAVKMLAIQVGVREAARQMGLSESTVQSWSERDKWFAPVVQPPTVIRATNATKTPSDALAQILADDSIHTRTGFSKAARKVATSLGEKPAGLLILPQTAQSARQWTEIAGKVHGWDAKSDGTGVNVAVNIGIIGS